MTFESIVTLGVGAIIGFIASIAKDWLMENKKEKEKIKQFKREKLEELFVILDKFNDNTMQSISEWTPFVEKARLDMIIRFYFSDKLKESYDSLLTMSREVLKVKTENKNHVDVYIEKFMPAYQKLLREITKESKNYL